MTDLDALSQLQLLLAGAWSIERELGRGGMATVYLARDVALDRPVALKVLHPHLAADPQQRERFLAEARTSARLSHPNIAPVYAVESQGDLAYFVMGLIDGETLGERIRRTGPVPAADAERILRDVAWALGYAHTMGLVHRDVTIENVLLERTTGRAVLADFGIAAEVTREGTGPLLGTPGYLAPEVIQGHAVSPQSDIYALGIVAWTMLAGRPPFLADETADLLLKHLSEPVPPVSRAAPATPSRIARAIDQALQKDPARRPLTVEAWASQLSAESTVALAVPLQRWLSRGELIRPMYAMGVIALWLWHQNILWKILLWDYRSRGLTGALMQAAGIILAAIPVFAALFAVHAIFEGRSLRRMARQGYGIADIQAALMRARERDRRAPVRPANRLALVVLGVVVAATLFQAIIISALPVNWREYVTMMRVPGGIWNRLAGWLAPASIAAWTGTAFLVLIPPFRGRAGGMMARLRERFWNSRLAGAFMRVASFGLPRLRQSVATVHRPTELVLDLAIDDLWQALDQKTRRRMGDVPATADRLRRRVADLKELERLLDNPRLEQSQETATLRARLSAQQVAGVTALERIRLAITRLSGAMIPEGELTQQLASARDVEQELLRELGAHDGLRRMLKRGGTTPQLTPV